MKLKTLFLGTAAAIVVASGAQAADLALAVEPVNYVKVCDAFGTGYYYLPGTDTCLKIGGYVQEDVWFYNHKNQVGNIYGQEAGPLVNLNTGGYVVGYASDSYSQSWEMKTEAGANFTAKSMSDLGPIVTFVDFRAASNNADMHGVTGPGTKNAYIDSYYGAIGPMMFGYTQSTFDVGGGYTYDGAVRSDTKTDQFRLSYLMGTWGIMLGLEDPRDRYSGPKNATGNYPDIVLSVTGGSGGLNFQASGAVTDRTSGTGWGVALAATGDFGNGFKLKAAGAYSDNAKSYTGNAAFAGGGGSNCSGACKDGQWWSAFISGSIALSGNMHAAATASYQDAADSRKNLGIFTGAVGVYYDPTSKSEIGAELVYSNPQTGKDTLGGHLRWVTNF